MIWFSAVKSDISKAPSAIVEWLIIGPKAETVRMN